MPHIKIYLDRIHRNQKLCFTYKLYISIQVNAVYHNNLVLLLCFKYTVYFFIFCFVVQLKMLQCPSYVWCNYLHNIQHTHTHTPNIHTQKAIAYTSKQS